MPKRKPLNQYAIVYRQGMNLFDDPTIIEGRTFVEALQKWLSTDGKVDGFQLIDATSYSSEFRRTCMAVTPKNKELRAQGDSSIRQQGGQCTSLILN